VRSSLLFLSLLGIVGCSSYSSGKASFDAPTAQVPISLTSGLVDEAGFVAPSRTRVVGKFHYATPGCVDRAFDISNAVNEQVARVHGQAIVRLVIDAKPSSDCVEARLKGDIVQVDP